MDIWSILRGRRGKPASPPPGYRVFTNKFDLEIRGEDIARMFPKRGATFQQYVTEYERDSGAWRARADMASLASVEVLKAQHDLAHAQPTVASLLIDHSGSMRGQRAILMTALAEIVADYLNRLGLKYELLGFTTSTWRGGRSRKAWIRAGRPAWPGRICDLLHIIYRSADENIPGAPWSIRNLMRPDLLKENVDGEAVMWASDRLRSRPETKKILVVVSDGAPVDDLTLHENESDILDRHIQSVATSLSAESGFTIAGIGIDHDVSRYYPVHLSLSSREEFATKLIPFLEALVAGTLAN